MKISRSTVWFEHRLYLVWIVLFQGSHFSPRYFSCTARDKSLRKSQRMRQMCRAPGRNHVHIWLNNVSNISVCESCCITAAVRLGIGLGLFALECRTLSATYSPWKMMFTGAHLMSICPTESGCCHELSHTFFYYLLSEYPYNQLQVHVPKPLVGFVIGRNGEHINNIQNTCGVRLQFQNGECIYLQWTVHHHDVNCLSLEV